VKCQADLLEIIPALRPPGSLSGLLHRRKEERNQDGNDGDYDE
jgi:hypothetical protein